MDVKILEKLNFERKQTWRKFLFKEKWFLNLVILLCIIGLFYNIIVLIVPSWFTSVDDFEPLFNESDAHHRQRLLHSVKRSAPIWLIIIAMFGISMCLLKWVFYHEKFVSQFYNIKFFNQYQNEVVQVFIKEKFAISNSSIPFELFKQSEIAGRSERISLDYKNQKMYFNPIHFIGTINGLTTRLGNVVYKAPYRNKGQEHIGVLLNTLLISIEGVNSGGRLKISQNKSGFIFRKAFQRKQNNDEKLVEINDANFENHFKIYSDNESSAMVFLNENMRGLLLFLKQNFDRKMEVTIINDLMTFSFPSQRSLLFAPLYRKISISRLNDNMKKLNSILHKMEEIDVNQPKFEGHAV
jgi:hypothetical protein